MGKQLLLVLTVLAVLAATSAALAASGKIVVEAEKYTSIAPSMARGTDATASGGAYVGIPLARPHASVESAPKDQGRAVYRVNIPAAGTYRFWGRTRWTDGCGNSFFVKIGAKPPVVLGQDGTYLQWHWVLGPTLALPAGPVQVVIQNREDGCRIDQFLFMKYVPGPRQRVPVNIER